MVAAVGALLLTERTRLSTMRIAAIAHAKPHAARHISDWIRTAIEEARLAGSTRTRYAGEPVP
jgi:hypothetical protein